MNALPLAFGRRLHEAMKAAGVYNADLARAVGVTPTCIKNWLTGRIPRADQVPAICERLGVSMEWLLTGVTEPKAGAGDEMVGAEAESAHSLAQAQQHLYFLTNLVELYREERETHLLELKTLRASCGKQTSEPHTPAHAGASATQDQAHQASGPGAGGIAAPEPAQPPGAHPDPGWPMSAPALNAGGPGAQASGMTPHLRPSPENQSRATNSCPQCAGLRDALQALLTAWEALN